MVGTSRDLRPVVVGVDPSDSSRDAAEWAADLAAAWAAPLHLVHVVPSAPDAEPPTGVPSWLAELSAATGRAGAHPREVEIVPGAITEQLTAHAAGARLLVLGSYGDGAWSGMLAGSVALDLLAHAGCPVAVVRGAAPQVPPPRGGPVVVGVDASPAGRSALILADELAASLGAQVVAVHTWSDVVAGPHGAPHRLPDDPATLAARAGNVLAAELAAVSAAHPGLQVEREVVGTTPVRALLERARGARALVVGQRGQRAGSSMLLGSTSRALVEFAPCPVVVTPAVGASS